MAVSASGLVSPWVGNRSQARPLARSASGRLARGRLLRGREKSNGKGEEQEATPLRLQAPQP